MFLLHKYIPNGTIAFAHLCWYGNDRVLKPFIGDAVDGVAVRAVDGVASCGAIVAV